jgi:predicted dinucleotide-binding enzyme
MSGARVVKAANTLGPDVLGSDPREADGGALFFGARDDADAKEDVVALFEHAGFSAIDLGDLATGGAMQEIQHPSPGST